MDKEQEKRIQDMCRLYLGGYWETASTISVKPLNKGCSNAILSAAISDETGRIIDKVLVRIYGQGMRNTENLVRDIFINTYLGFHVGSVPKIRGLFDGGRLEEYKESTNISRENFRLEYKKVLRSMALVHNLQNMPLPKECKLITEMRSMYDKIPGTSVMRAEVDWFIRTLTALSAGMSMRLCHNDVNQNNILIPEEDTDRIILIDYEYAGYNYVTFDIANYCCELQYDWSHPHSPFYIFNRDWFPDDAGIRDMISYYKTLVTPVLETTDEIILKQVKLMTLGSELLWAVWSLTLDQVFNLDMNKYAEIKTESYFDKKERFGSDIRDLLGDQE